MKYKVSLVTGTKFLALQAFADAALAGVTDLGSFTHPDPVDDELGYAGNHMIQNHVRDVCYHKDIRDMANYQIIDMVGKAVEKDWRDFFISFKADGTRKATNGIPAVGTSVTLAKTVAGQPGKIDFAYAGDVRTKITASDIYVNSKKGVISNIGLTGVNTTFTVQTDMLEIPAGKMIYFRHRPK